MPKLPAPPRFRTLGLIVRDRLAGPSDLGFGSSGFAVGAISLLVGRAVRPAGAPVEIRSAFMHPNIDPEAAYPYIVRTGRRLGALRRLRARPTPAAEMGSAGMTSPEHHHGRRFVP